VRCDHKLHQDGVGARARSGSRLATRAAAVVARCTFAAKPIVPGTHAHPAFPSPGKAVALNRTDAGRALRPAKFFAPSSLAFQMRGVREWKPRSLVNFGSFRMRSLHGIDLKLGMESSFNAGTVE